MLRIDELITRIKNCTNPGCGEFGCECLDHLRIEAKFEADTNTKMDLRETGLFIRRCINLGCPNGEEATKFAKENF